MTEPPQALLRLEPHAIPALIGAFDRAIEEMRPLLRDIVRRGRLPEPWLGDPMSAGVFDWYHWRVMGDGDREGQSAHAKLRAYEAELINVRRGLVAAEAEYRRADESGADLLDGRS